jgi:hypothetical protein
MCDTHHREGVIETSEDRIASDKAILRHTSETYRT